nr:peroxisomal fatty acid beta-oxidation multifunctional protein AIM1-like [Ipomoea batatas]
MAVPTVTMEVGNDAVAVITISNPPVNALAVPIIHGLKEKFTEAARRNDVKAIVLTGSSEVAQYAGGSLFPGQEACPRPAMASPPLNASDIIGIDHRSHRIAKFASHIVLKPRIVTQAGLATHPYPQLRTVRKNGGAKSQLYSRHDAVIQFWNEEKLS